MTIIAGLFRYDGRVLDEHLCNSIRVGMSRNPADTPTEFRTPVCYLAKVDVGAYGENAFERRGHTSAAIMAGDPLLPDVNERTRTADLSRLHDGLLACDLSPLRITHGSFCSAHYSGSPERLTLVVDKLALRPLYCWHHQGLVVFASALRILENMIGLRKSLDTRGLCEQLSFGYPLGDRTAYQEIRCLRAGEIVSFDADGEQRVPYWRWDSIPNCSLEPAKAPRLVRWAIERAIAYRLKSRETSVAAFLSGGLDSRLIATVLRDSVGDLHTFTFADENLLDCFLAQEYANRLGSRHHSYPSSANNVHPSACYGAILTSKERTDLPCLDRPQLVWSGDGGSVCMGHVYLNELMVELLRNGREAAAINEFLRFNRKALATRRILGDLFDNIPANFPAQSVEAEFDVLHCTDTAMKAYLFLLLNDQRRHLSVHFENIDLTRTELHLPLFDSSILELMIRIPIEAGLYHNIYHEIMRHFPDIVAAVPWQAYPGHLPCPLKTPETLLNQWQYHDSRRNQITTGIAGKTDIRRYRNAPRSILRKREVYLAYWMTRLGLSDRSYLLKGADTAYLHWKICSASAGDHVRAKDRISRTRARSTRSMVSTQIEPPATVRSIKSRNWLR